MTVRDIGVDYHNQVDQATSDRFAPLGVVSDLSPQKRLQNLGQIEYHFEKILQLLGENVDREGLRETPARIARAWTELMGGLYEDPREHLRKTFSSRTDEMIVVRDIPFVSLCEHHLVPFIGTCQIGYIPGPLSAEDFGGPYRITGLSKFPRMVQGYASRPQVQEQLTDQVASAIEEILNPQGCIVVMKASHMCMSLRGIKAQGSETVTSAVRGLFATNEDGVKSEFMTLLTL